MLFGIIEKLGVYATQIWYSFWSLTHRPRKTAPYPVRCILDRRIRLSRILDTRLPGPAADATNSKFCYRRRQTNYLPIFLKLSTLVQNGPSFHFQPSAPSPLPPIRGRGGKLDKWTIYGTTAFLVTLIGPTLTAYPRDTYHDFCWVVVLKRFV